MAKPITFYCQGDFYWDKEKRDYILFNDIDALVTIDLDKKILKYKQIYGGQLEDLAKLKDNWGGAISDYHYSFRSELYFYTFSRYTGRLYRSQNLWKSFYNCEIFEKPIF